MLWTRPIRCFSVLVGPMRDPGRDLNPTILAFREIGRGTFGGYARPYTVIKEMVGGISHLSTRSFIEI